MDWLLLVYRLPSEPSKGRVAVWREVKKLGAAYLQNGVCLLPADPSSEAAFAQLVQRIAGLGGEAMLFRAVSADPGQETAIVAEFDRLRDQEYAELYEQGAHFLAEVAKETRAGKFTFGEMEEIEEDLEKLTRWMAKVTARDRFNAPGRERALARLAECQQAYEEFARRVFEQGEE
ncbi:MAG: chromate resistance protein ChrB [Bacillota bacterium]|nr:chromate resistance protein ChrB [Bacillota bacterium]